MGQTTIIEECYDDFNTDTGEIRRQTRRTVKKKNVEVTDEFVKVSKYLNTIFAFNEIPLQLVPIALLLAQNMEFKTNYIYLLKDKKLEFAEMLDISLDRVNKLIQECVKYNILKSVCRGKYEVNSFLFSTGSISETRELQAHFDFVRGSFTAGAVQKRIDGATVRKAVANKKDKDNIKGQMSITDMLKDKGDEQ